MRVLKFGGTSLSHAQRLETVTHRVAEVRRGGPVVVVVSALGGVTDELTRALGAAERGEPSPGLVRRLRERHLEDPASRLGAAAREQLAIELEPWLRELERLLEGVAHLGEVPVGVRHRVLATGERLSAPRIAAWLRAADMPAVVVDGSSVLRADGELGQLHGAAQIDQRATRQQVMTGLGALVRGEVPVVTGFLAAEAQGRTVTLGRGASDLSATTLAAALEADLVEIWTDTDGVLSADPRRVSSAVPLRSLSFDQAAALARYGAKVLHPETLAPVRNVSLPVELRCTYQPELPGTRIRGPLDEGAEACQGEPEAPALAVTSVPVTHLELTAAPLSPLGSTALGVLEQLRLDPLHTSGARGLISLWLRSEEADGVESELRRQLRPFKGAVARRDGLAALALLPRDQPATFLAGDVARLLASRGLAVHATFVDAAGAGGQGTQDPAVAVAVIDRSAAEMALEIVHGELVVPTTRHDPQSAVSWAASG